MELVQHNVKVGIVLFLFSLSALEARAQCSSAIEGTVTDPSGAFVPDALVILQNISMMLEDFPIRVAEIKTANVALELAADATEVTVTRSLAAVEVGEGRISEFIPEGKLHDLPLVGRNFYSTSALPVVVLTSSREEQDLLRSYQLGVNAYVVKPVNFQDFVTAVKELGIFWAITNEPPPGSFRRRHGLCPQRTAVTAGPFRSPGSA